MNYLQVKNWAEFQQYRDREPKWIKVYRTLLMDYKYEQLTDAEFGQLVKIWLLASQLDNQIPDDPAWIQRKAGLSAKPNIKKYLQLDFLQQCEPVQNCTEAYSSVLRDRDRDRERRETEKKNTCAKSPAPPNGKLSEKQQERFDRFWDAYPKKKSKGQAISAWKKIQPDEQLAAQILNALGQLKTAHDWIKEGGKFIPYPATWLNAMGWEDEAMVAVAQLPYSEKTARNIETFKNWEPPK